jgi:hypothetical protein
MSRFGKQPGVLIPAGKSNRKNPHTGTLPIGLTNDSIIYLHELNDVGLLPNWRIDLF